MYFSHLVVVSLEEQSCSGCLAAVGAGIVTLAVGQGRQEGTSWVCEEPLPSCVAVALDVGTGRAGLCSAGIPDTSNSSFVF